MNPYFINKSFDSKKNGKRILLIAFEGDYSTFIDEQIKLDARFVGTTDIVLLSMSSELILKKVWQGIESRFSSISNCIGIVIENHRGKDFKSHELKGGSSSIDIDECFSELFEEIINHSKIKEEAPPGHYFLKNIDSSKERKKTKFFLRGSELVNSTLDGKIVANQFLRKFGLFDRKIEKVFVDTTDVALFVLYCFGENVQIINYNSYSNFEIIKEANENDLIIISASTSGELEKKIRVRSDNKVQIYTLVGCNQSSTSFVQVEMELNDTVKGIPLRIQGDKFAVNIPKLEVSMPKFGLHSKLIFSNEFKAFILNKTLMIKENGELCLNEENDLESYQGWLDPIITRRILHPSIIIIYPENELIFAKWVQARVQLQNKNSEIDLMTEAGINSLKNRSLPTLGLVVSSINSNYKAFNRISMKLRAYEKVIVERKYLSLLSITKDLDEDKINSSNLKKASCNINYDLLFYHKLRLDEKQLTKNILSFILTFENQNKLMLQPGYAYWTDYIKLENWDKYNQYYDGLMVTMASVMHESRLTNNIISNSNGVKLLDPEYFIRHNDPILQIIILSNALSSELDYALDETAGNRITDIILELILQKDTEYLMALVGFLKSISFGKLTLIKTCKSKIIKKLESNFTKQESEKYILMMTKEDVPF